MRSMRLQISNINAIKEADIRLDGITVLTGENGTGKSTVCRTLFATIKALRKDLDDVRWSRRRSVWALLMDYRMRSDTVSMGAYDQSLETLMDALADLNPKQADEKSIRSILDRSLPPDGNEDVEERMLLIDRLCKRLSYSSEEVLRQLRGDVMRGEHVFDHDAQGPNGYMEAEFTERRPIRLTVQGDVIILSQPESAFVNTSVDVTMLDDPRLLDDTGVFPSFAGRRRRPKDTHASDLTEKILDHDETDAVTALANNDSIASVLNALRDHAGGDLIVDRYGLKFQEDGLNRVLDMQDVSDGRKTFIMLLRLLSDNQLNEDDVLILDEPEIHLHPAWQLDLAKMLVELRHAFHLTILVSTHSPYFLEALETYTNQRKITDEAHYYMMRRQDGACVCEDVTHQLERAYGVLAEPFNRLDNEEGE